MMDHPGNVAADRTREVCIGRVFYEHAALERDYPVQWRHACACDQRYYSLQDMICAINVHTNAFIAFQEILSAFS